jgi:hypothetical protein
MGDATAIDLVTATKRGELERLPDLNTAWVTGAWTAWSAHHAAIRATADGLGPAALTLAVRVAPARQSRHDDSR